MPIDIDSLLAPISEEAPCGEDSRYDPAYLEMERVAQGTQEQQIGDTIVEAEEPDWREVRKQALAVLAKSKDLWAIVHLTWALTRMEGLSGLRDAMTLLAGVLEKYWPEVHPQLDPDDNDDPVERLNILREFASPAEMQAPPRLFDILLTTPLCDYPVLHRSFALREVRIAKGELALPTGQGAQRPPDDAMLTAAFCGAKLPPDRQTELQENAKATAAAAMGAAEQVAAIDQLMVGHVGAGQLDVAGLGLMLQEVGTRINEYLVQGGVGGVAPAGVAGAAAGPQDPGAAAAPGQAISGDIRSAEDVIRVLDKVCEYYARTEPSSPVPLLLRRARNLVRKDFVEIIRDLNPDGLSRIEMISGPLKQPEGQ